MKNYSSLILFNKKIRNQKLKIFKILLIITLIVNVLLILYFLFIKNFLLKTKNENEEISKKINDLLYKNSNYINENNYRMVNILSNPHFFWDLTNFKLSFILKNIDDFSLIKPILKIDNTKIYIFPEYQYSTDGYKRDIIYKKIYYSFIILIETYNNYRFGIIKNKVKNENFTYFFSFDLLKIFKPLKKDINIDKYEEGNILLKIGDKDLIIYENFNLTDNGGYSEYKNFELIDYLENPLVGINGFFSIKEMEIYSIYYKNIT